MRKRKKAKTMKSDHPKRALANPFESADADPAASKSGRDKTQTESAAMSQLLPTNESVTVAENPVSFKRSSQTWRRLLAWHFGPVCHPLLTCDFRICLLHCD